MRRSNRFWPRTTKRANPRLTRWHATSGAGSRGLGALGVVSLIWSAGNTLYIAGILFAMPFIGKDARQHLLFTAR